MNEATRAKRRRLTAAVEEYQHKRPQHTDAGAKVLLRDLAAKHGVTQKAIREASA